MKYLAAMPGYAGLEHYRDEPAVRSGDQSRRAKRPPSISHARLYAPPVLDGYRLYAHGDASGFYSLQEVPLRGAVAEAPRRTPAVSRASKKLSSCACSAFAASSA
jgi:hypothetical protein